MIDKVLEIIISLPAIAFVGAVTYFTLIGIYEYFKGKKNKVAKV